jgi:serine protease Do
MYILWGEITMSTLLKQLNEDLSGIVTGVRRSLVRVMDGRGGAGAGTIWHSDGLIVTNAHVVARGGDIRVGLPDGREFPAQVLARDTDHDLAALAIEATDLPTIEPGDSRSVHAGQWVMALGHPWGVTDAVTGGVVIGTGKDLIELEQATGREWVAVSLHLRPGNSGGPLVDTAGRLVGINTLMTGPDVGVAVPVDVVKQFLKNALGNRVPSTPAPERAPTEEFV